MANKQINRTVKIHIDGEEVDGSVRTIQGQLRKLTGEMKNLTIGTDEYNKKVKEIRELNRILTEHRNTLRGVEEETKGLASSLKDIMKIGLGTFIGNIFSGLKDKISAAVAESVELAQSAEGIELAFARIDKPGMLEALREETHNALSDLTLMTQAVKFKDFNLPIEQMGTYLAYAQQKAKDTGQDLGYLVDSIVTGLGRQSLPILDNLGLSATEIREEMKKTGDMFTAVANIIEKNMSATGEYTETAADRAAQAAARLENAQVELGKELLPMKEAADEAFGSVQMGAIETIKWMVHYRDTIFAVVSAIAAVTVASQAYVIWQKTVATWNTVLATGNKIVAASMTLLRGVGVALHAMWALVTKGVKGYTVVMRAASIASITNPFTALLTVITALGAAFVLLGRRMKESKELHNELAEAQREADLEGRQAVATLELLYKATQDANRPLDERKRYIAELRKQFPSYFKDLSDEEILAGKAANAYQKLSKELIATARARAYQKRIEKLAEENADLETSLDSDLDWLIANEGKYNKEKASGRINRNKKISTAEFATPGAASASSAMRSGFISEYEERENRVLEKQDQIRKNDQKMQALSKKALAPVSADEPVYTPTPSPVTTTPKKTGKGGGGSTTNPEDDAEKARLKRIQEEQLAISEEYQKKENALTKQYVDGEIATTEELQSKLEQLEMERLQKELEILGLEQSEKEKILAQIYEMQKTWKERENQNQAEQDAKKLEEVKTYLEKSSEENDAALKAMEEREKERANLILNVAQQFGSAFGDMMATFFEEGELQFGEFLKNIIKLTLDALEKTMVAAIAERTIKDIATLGVAGIAKAAAEIAGITAAFETAKAAIGSFDVGGFTGPGNWNEARGVVHANEFVANRHALRNSAIMPVLSLIDAAQKTGSVGNLTSADIAAVLPMTPVTTRGGSGGGDKQMMAMIASLNKSNQMLLARLKEPIVAETYATGKRGVNEAQTLVEKMRSNVSRS